MARDLRTRTFGVATHRAASGDVAAPAAADGLHTLPPDETSSAVTPDIDHHNRVTALAAQRAWDVLEPRLADLIAPVLRRAGRTAAARFRHHATRSMTAAAYRTSDRLRLAALSPGERQQLMLSLAMTAAGPPDLAATATMVCVMPTPEQQAALAVGDQDAAILHVTLVYLGEYDGPLNRLAAVMAPVAATFAPLHGTVAGRGTFGDNVQLLLPDVPGLVELRVAVTQALVAAGLDYARDHGYLSHITVSYTPVADDGGVVGTPLDFADLLIVRGNTEVIRLPFVGMPPITAAGDASRSTQSAVSAQAIASQLAETQLLEEAALKAEQRAQSTASQEELRSAIERVDEARRIAGDAQHSGDPERIFNASRALQVAQDNLMRTLQSASPPAGAPGPGGPGEQPGAPPVQPGPAQPAGKLQPLPTHAQLPGPSEVVHEIQKSKTQELFGPPGERPTPTSVGLSLDQLLEQEALMQGPGEAAASHEPPDWTRPSGHELLNTDELMQQVRGVTDPVRQAVIRSVGTPIVENAGIGWNDANPFAARVLAQSASQVTHITETTQAKLMQIVNTSYEQGLTIPDTAKLIQQHMAEATPARARLIARTELAGAVNGGSLAATQIVQQATGTQYRKTWLTAPGAPHPRHENYDGLDGQQADLDGYFTVGDARLQYPGDPAGPPEEVCNCRCTLTYAEAATDDNGGTVTDTTAVGTPTTPDTAAVPAGTLQTSDPAAAAQALADGQNVVLNQPDEISTFLEDLGQQAAQAQAAGKAALNLDLGKVSVKGTNLFTQDSLGIPRIDMPQLSGKPLPGSLASKLPGGYEGQADQVDIGPLFYQHLRDQGVTITEEDVLASHLRSTQRDINGAKVAGLMDRLAAGTAPERRIPISADGYIVDGHHEWAATIGLDYKTGTDAGLTLPVYRINQPITKILGEANAFDAHYGIPRVSAFVPKVTDATTARVLDQTVPAVAAKDPILGITPFRAGEDNPLGFYTSAKAQQFEADLQQVAAKDGLTITSSQHVTGVWEGATEPSYAVHMLGDPATVNAFAEEMRARYNQDGVMVFVPKKDMPRGMTPNAAEYRLSGVDPTTAMAQMQSHGLPGGTIRGHQLSIVSTDAADGQRVADLAHALGVDPSAVTVRYGHVEFVNRPEAAAVPAHAEALKAPDAAIMRGRDANAGMVQYDADRLAAERPLAHGLPGYYPNASTTEGGAIMDALESTNDRAFAKAQVTDQLTARLANNADWQTALERTTPTDVAYADIKVGDTIRLDPGVPTIKVTSVSNPTPVAAGLRLIDDEIRVMEPTKVGSVLVMRSTKLRVVKYGDHGPIVEVTQFEPGLQNGLQLGQRIELPHATPTSVGGTGYAIRGTVVDPAYGYNVGGEYKAELAASELGDLKIQRFQPGASHPFPEGEGGTGPPSRSALAASGLVDTWAGTSADSNPWAIALQRAVHDEFRLDTSGYQFLAKRDLTAARDADAIYAEDGAALRAFVRAQYDQTQEFLAANGVKDVTVYRGVTLSDMAAEAKNAIPAGGHIAEVALQPASSFAADFSTARSFTGGDSAIIAAQVPAGRVFATPRTGIGCLNETEYVVLGRAADAPVDQGYVYRFRNYETSPKSPHDFWTPPATTVEAAAREVLTAPLSSVPVEASILKPGMDVKLDKSTLDAGSQFDYQPGTVLKITGVDPNGAVFADVVAPGGGGLTVGQHVGLGQNDLVQPVKIVTPSLGLPQPPQFPVGSFVFLNTKGLAHVTNDPVWNHNGFTGETSFLVTGKNIAGDPFLVAATGPGKGMNAVVPVAGLKGAKSTDWTFGPSVTKNDLAVGDVVKGPSGLIVKYQGVDANGNPFGEVIDPNGHAEAVGAHVDFTKGTLFQQASGEPSKAATLPPMTWVKEADALTPVPGDTVMVTGNALGATLPTAGAVVKVTGGLVANGGVIKATVVDPGSSSLNVGETYLLPPADDKGNAMLAYVHQN